MSFDALQLAKLSLLRACADLVTRSIFLYELKPDDHFIHRLCYYMFVLRVFICIFGLSLY